MKKELEKKIFNWAAFDSGKYEVALIILAMVGYVMTVSEFAEGNLLVMLSLNFLSILYVLSAFGSSEYWTSGWMIFSTKLSGFGLAISVVGVMFCIQHWPGFMVQLIAGISALIVALLVAVVSRIKFQEENKGHSSIEIRIVFWLILSICFALI